MANLITGLFDSETAAENAVAQLKQIGYNQNEISIIMKDRNAAVNLAHETGSRAMEDAGKGAVIGGTLGAILMGVLAVGTIALPGVGIIAAGGLAAMLAGAGAGGIAGSLVGWLVGAGIPEDVAPYYERGINEGGVIVAVAAHSGQEQMVQQVLQGGSVAYAGAGIPSYVSPSYQSRYSDLSYPPKTYDSTATTAYRTGVSSPEAQRTVNSMGAQERSDMRTAAEHEREAARESQRTNPLTSAAASIQNEADRVGTGLQNQTDKVGTGLSNEADRIKRP